MEAGGAVAEVEEEWCCCLAINGWGFVGHCDEGQSLVKDEANKVQSLHKASEGISNSR